MAMSAAERVLRARLGGLATSARHDPRAMTAPARAAFASKFEALVPAEVTGAAGGCTQAGAFRAAGSGVGQGAAAEGREVRGQRRTPGCVVRAASDSHSKRNGGTHPMTNQQDTRPTMEPPPRGVLLAVSWAYAITTALEDRLTSGGVYAQVTPDEFRRHIDRLLGHYEDALKGAAR